jgi:hypothetical protein
MIAELGRQNHSYRDRLIRFGPRGALWAARPLHRTLEGASDASPSRRVLPVAGEGITRSGH